MSNRPDITKKLSLSLEKNQGKKKLERNQEYERE